VCMCVCACVVVERVVKIAVVDTDGKVLEGEKKMSNVFCTLGNIMYFPINS